VAFREELPYSPTGKLLRRVLRDELALPAQGADEAS
jgi:acyl-coenzyme A synthetase/AMP-(fatty) acid ligase